MNPATTPSPTARRGTYTITAEPPGFKKYEPTNSGTNQFHGSAAPHPAIFPIATSSTTKSSTNWPAPNSHRPSSPPMKILPPHQPGPHRPHTHPDEVRAFLADTSSNKRESVIDNLLNSDAFDDRWTMWFGDLLENCSFPALSDCKLPYYRENVDGSSTGHVRQHAREGRYDVPRDVAVRLRPVSQRARAPG